MPLWDDATAGVIGQQPQQDSSSLWGWLSSLFNPRNNQSFQPGWDRQPAGTGSARPPDFYNPQTDPVTGARYRAPGWNMPSSAGSTVAPTTSANMTPEQVRTAAGLPTWGGMSGVPASMLVAPPSMYTAANPQQQAAWQQASTPEGYAAALGQAPPPGAAPPAVTPMARTPAAMMPPPPKPMPPPVIEGPRNIMPPAGGSTGWGGYGTMGMLPPGYGPTAPSSLVTPSPTASGIPLTDTKSRNLSDAELEKMSKEDIARATARTDLTYGDRMAILQRL